MTHRLRALLDGGTHVTVGHGRTVHRLDARDRHSTACGIGPGAYVDTRRGTVEPVPWDRRTPTGSGPLKVTDQPVTCPECGGLEPAA